MFFSSILTHYFRCFHTQIYLLNVRVGSFSAIVLHHSSFSSSSWPKSSSSMILLVLYLRFLSPSYIFLPARTTCTSTDYLHSLLTSNFRLFWLFSHIFGCLDSFTVISIPRNLKWCKPLTIIISKLETGKFPLQK